MRKLFLFLSLSSMLFLTSCLDVIEEIYLNKDGSGKFQITMDMGTLLSDPMMKGLVEQSLREEGGLEEGESMEMDSLVNFRALLEEKGKTVENPEFWEKATMHMVMSESKEAMFVNFNLDFDKLSDIDYFLKNMGQVTGEEDTNGMISGMMSQAAYSLKGKKLTRVSPDADSMDLEGEEMGMLKMFMAEASYKTIIHLPGKVKNTSIPGARIDGKTVTAEVSMLDVLEGKSSLDGEVKFR